MIFIQWFVPIPCFKYVIIFCSKLRELSIPKAMSKPFNSLCNIWLILVEQLLLTSLSRETKQWSLEGFYLLECRGTNIKIVIFEKYFPSTRKQKINSCSSQLLDSLTNQEMEFQIHNELQNLFETFRCTSNWVRRSSRAGVDMS